MVRESPIQSMVPTQCNCSLEFPFLLQNSTDFKGNIAPKKIIIKEIFQGKITGYTFFHSIELQMLLYQIIFQEHI